MILIDTHVFAWIVWREPLAPAARSAIVAASRSQAVFVSAVTPWELGILVAKKRIELGEKLETWWADAIKSSGFEQLPLDAQSALASTQLPEPFHSDPADRFLVATARVHGLALVTADKSILSYAKKGHVRAIRAR